jgi:alkanesulfonate monooxygenase SsuD/methylene tetrahydromethanopterin reductase-like flavin-dependent oxidoreductase (luciferase family)
MIGGGGRQVLGLAGREADIVSINFNNSTGRLGPHSLAGATSEETERKIQWIKEAAGERFDSIELEIAAYFTVVTSDPDRQTQGMAAAFGLAAEDVAEHPHILIGSVEEICARLHERRDRYGISYVSVGASVMEDFSAVVERLTGQ